MKIKVVYKKTPIIIYHRSRREEQMHLSTLVPHCTTMKLQACTH